MTWRREDYGYAAATVAAVVFLAYLIAGNFGIVPSPLQIGRSDELPEPDVAVLAVAASNPKPIPIVPIAPAPKDNRKGRQDANRKPTPVYARPTATILTKSGTKVSLTDPGAINGTANAPAGIVKVVVSFLPSSGAAPIDVIAALKCDAARHACSWVVPIPSLAGVFTVRATVTDTLGRNSASKPIDITVLNTGTVVGGVTNTLTAVVEDAPQTLESVAGAVNNLVSLLGL